MEGELNILFQKNKLPIELRRKLVNQLDAFGMALFWIKSPLAVHVLRYIMTSVSGIFWFVAKPEWPLLLSQPDKVLQIKIVLIRQPEHFVLAI